VSLFSPALAIVSLAGSPFYDRPFPAPLSMSSGSVSPLFPLRISLCAQQICGLGVS